jgi:hypothetical protein
MAKTYMGEGLYAGMKKESIIRIGGGYLIWKKK